MSVFLKKKIKKNTKVPFVLPEVAKKRHVDATGAYVEACTNDANVQWGRSEI